MGSAASAVGVRISVVIMVWLSYVSNGSDRRVILSTQKPYDLWVTLIQLIARRLRELRLRHELTQEEFAQVAGFSFKFYQQLESGSKKQIWLETVERLAAAYGLSVPEFLADNPPGKTRLSSRPASSRVHNRKGPYGRAQK